MEGDIRDAFSVHVVDVHRNLDLDGYDARYFGNSEERLQQPPTPATALTY
jgi:hypothetical protein